MQTHTVNQHYCTLLESYGIKVNILTVDDPKSPSQEVVQEGNQFTIRLNPSKFIPDLSYESYVAYNARKILLPRLVLETPRLVLRRFRNEDAVSCFEFLSDRTSCYDDGGYEPFAEMNDSYYQLMEEFATGEGRYMIALKETDEAIGTIHIWEDNSRAVDAMEMGYCINPSQRRKGYAFEAASALIHLLQDELKLELLLGGAFANNTASLFLLKKLGFRQEGIVRKAIWHVEKGPVDLIHFYRER